MQNLHLITLPMLPLVITRADDRWKRPTHGLCNDPRRAPPQRAQQWLCRGLILLALAVVPGLQSPGHAQDNLANLYDCVNQTMNVSDPSQFIMVYSSNSALFRGGFADSNGGALPPPAVAILTGNLDTTPGTTYEISFTMLDPVPFTGGASMAFGNLNTSLDFTSCPNYTNPNQPFQPINFDFTAIASSTSTSLSFSADLDPDGGAVYLEDLTVTAVPEPSATGFLGSMAAGWLLLAQRCWQSREKRSQAGYPKADSL
jgi:hypothetical protein